MTRTMERRESARFPTVASRLKVEWWDGDTSQLTSARLINISRDGVLLDIEQPPPVRQAVWLKMEDPASTDWIGASVVRHDGPHGVGLLFQESCPYDLYQAAILGIALDNLLDRGEK